MRAIQCFPQRIYASLAQAFSQCQKARKQVNSAGFCHGNEKSRQVKPSSFPLTIFTQAVWSIGCFRIFSLYVSRAQAYWIIHNLCHSKSKMSSSYQYRDIYKRTANYIRSIKIKYGFAQQQNKGNGLIASCGDTLTFRERRYEQSDDNWCRRCR